MNEFIKFNIVGVVNTFFGFSVVFTLMFCGVTPELSNAIGYASGAVVSFILNMKFTFYRYRKTRMTFFWFFGILCFAYILNMVVLLFMLNVAKVNEYASQVVAGVTYTVTSFLIMKNTIFAKRMLNEKNN